MNINFHYFAVKTIALATGLSEDDAQLIASYSQQVDDFDIHGSMILNNVPDYALHLAEGKDSPWKFYPVTTGFNKTADMMRLLSTSHQKYIVVPFHFITTKKLSDFNLSTCNREDLRTVPTDRKNNNLLMNVLLYDAYVKFIGDPSKMSKMRIGMLLHIFADTFAHEKFSGFWGWENKSILTKVIDLTTNNDITNVYDPAKYSNFPAVGHAKVSHAPDDTFVIMDTLMKGTRAGATNVASSRNNFDYFTIAARAIHEYIADCFGLQRMTDVKWTVFKVLLHKGFYFQENDISQIATLRGLWGGIFPGYSYSYNPEFLILPLRLACKSDNPTDLSEDEFIHKMMYEKDFPYKDVVLNTMSHDFFRYNVLAKEIRDKVNGVTTPIKAISDAAEAEDLVETLAKKEI